jgi:hypothetical protein
VAAGGSMMSHRRGRVGERCRCEFCLRAAGAAVGGERVGQSLLAEGRNRWGRRSMIMAVAYIGRRGKILNPFSPHYPVLPFWESEPAHLQKVADNSAQPNPIIILMFSFLSLQHLVASRFVVPLQNYV